MGWLGDAWGAVATGLSYVAAYNPGSLLFAAATPGTAAGYQAGVQRILTGTVGEDPDGDGSFNPSLGDAWRLTAGDFLPDYAYTPPKDWSLPGTQHGDSPLADDVKAGLPVALIAAVAVFALASR